MQSYPSPSAVAADSGGTFYTPNNPQNQQSNSLQNPDEFQLTAQLATGLAPMIGVATDGSMAESQVSRGQSQANFNQQFEHEHDQHSHLQPRPGSLDQTGGQYAASDSSLAPRKRIKVSRACDECRRKKIRCDATSDQDNEYCSNCKRVGARCQFSRIPMKRGPSKGYIKELADRVHTLEGAMHSGEMAQQYLPANDTLRRSSEDFSPSQNGDNLRKRRISTNAEFGPYISQRQVASWNQLGQDAPRHLPHPSSGFASPQTVPASTNIFRETTYSPNSLQTAIWRNEPGHSRRQSSSYEDLATDQASPKREIEFDNTILEAYYKFIHPTSCLFPHNKNRAITQLSNCPANLREAVYEALSGAVRHLIKNNSSPLNVQRAAAQYTLTSSLEDVTTRPLRINIIYLQTMLLWAIAAESNALINPKFSGGVGYSRSVWISNTISLAYALKLYLYKSDKLKDVNPDSDEKVARRIWWTLYIMDRWNAASTSSPVLIPDTASVLYPDDLTLLGNALWNLARLSTILGHISTINTVSSTLPPLSVPLASAYGATVKGELERVRESFLATDCQPLVLMAYWHIRILVELQLVDSEPNDLVDIAANAINHLDHNSEFDSPLKNHFIFLIILTLVDLLGYDMTKSQSESNLDFMFEKQLVPTVWETSVRTMVIKKKTCANSTSTSSPSHPLVADSEHKVDIENLVRLADLATAAEANREMLSTLENSDKQIPTSPFRYYSQLREQVRNGILSVFTLEPAQG